MEKTRTHETEDVAHDDAHDEEKISYTGRDVAMMLLTILLVLAVSVGAIMISSALLGSDEGRLMSTAEVSVVDNTEESAH